MEDPVAIANYFVKKSFDEGIDITPMKLVKLVYISHGWYLALADKPLLSERVEAWQYGPVIPSVYQAFRQYGSNDITQAAKTTNADGSYTYNYVSDTSVTRFLDKIWDVYKEKDDIQLSALIHQEDTPWSITLLEDSDEERKGIPNDIIAAHYKGLADNNIAKARAAKVEEEAKALADAEASIMYG